MANIIGGNGTGTLDTSLYQLNSNGTTGAGTAGDNEQISINVSDGNLVISHLDEYLPSETDNLLTTRTYNSQGQFNTPDGEGWTLSEFSRLSVITPTQIVVLNSDGSQFTFNYVPSLGVYRSVDGAGAYETISFNARTGTYSLTQSNQTVLTYDLTGRLVQSQDTNGNTISYNYNLFGQLTSVADNSGHKLTFVYNLVGQLTQIHDETGTVFASYQYVGNELVSMTDRAGQTTRYTYNLDGTLRSMTLPSSAGEAARTLSFTYIQGPDGPMVASFTDAQGNVTRFNYNFNVTLFGIQGGTTTVTDAAGNVTAYTFNSQSEITDVRDAQGNDTVYGYDQNQNLTSVMDANGSAIIRSNSTYYRNLRQSFGIVDASGQGKLVSELTFADIAALQAHFTTHYTYDSNGNLTSQTDATGSLTTYTYTSFNKLASTTSAEGNALVTSNDPLSLAKRQELGYVNPTTGVADTVAQLTAAQKQAILALYTTTYTYDAHQNLTQMQAPGGDLTRFAYDSFGNLTQKTVYLDSTNLTDPSKQETTQYFYDGFGNNIKTVDAQGATTLATYDHFGNKLTQVDGNGGVTTNQYDAENRLVSTTDPLGNTTFNFYDAVGNKIAVEDAAGHTITYVYNSDNLLLSVIDPSLTNAAQTRTTQYTYDVMGNRTRTTDANGNTTTYTYDALNRMLTVTTPTVTNASGAAVKYVTSYAYDGVGNRITTVDNNGNTTNSIYNADNLLTSLTDASGNITQYAYDANLNQVSIVVGAQLAATARQLLKFDYDEKNRLISQTDALGNVQHYAYDGANNRIAATDANGNTTNFTYDRDNRLLTVTTPTVTNPTTGQSVRYTTQYQYDANGNQVAVTDADGHTTQTTFDKDNRMVLVKDANGIQTVYTYDSRGNRTSVQIGVQAHVASNGSVVVDSTQNAQVETYTYNEFNEVVTATDGVGNALISSDSALYVQMRQQLGIVNPTGQGKLVAQLTAADIQKLKAQFTATYTYDRDGNYTSTTDHLGHTTSFIYDALNRLVDTTDALGGQTKVAYDGNGNVVKHTDALGHTTTYAYDSMNRVVDTKDALGVDTQRTYDAFGNVVSSTVASGTTAARTTTYVYDLDNRLTSTADALGNTQRYTYDAVGNRLQVTNAEGHTTQYVYDAMNRNIAIIDPLGFQTRMTYDGVGNKLSLIDAKGGVTAFTYDVGNREISMQDAMGRVTTYTYDVLGDRITQTTAAGTSSQETTTFLYDAEHNLRQVTDASGNVSTQNYDAAYNLTSVADANGNTTRYAYDALNRQIQVTNALGGVTRYTYDAVGNRLSVTDANGHLTTYAYDARNEMIAATDATGVQTTYAYDAIGNQVKITYAANTSAAATETFGYDLDNRLITQTDALGHTTTHTYDANGNAIAVTDPLGHTTHYTYDANNRVASITDPLGNTTWYYYDGNGNRVQVEDPRGFTTTSYFNADNEVTLSVDNDGYATSFSYDANGNVISQTLYANPVTVPPDGLDPTVQPTLVTSAADQTKLFTYDAMNWMTSQTNGEGYVTQFVYDAVGNRIQTRQALDLAGTQFEVTHCYYDALNRQVADVTAQGYLTTYQYDAVGNRIGETDYNQTVSIPSSGAVPQPVAGDAGRTTTSVYDSDNRLVQQTNALGAVTTYQYDARSNLIAMTQGAGTAGARTTTYQYDAANRNVATTNALGITTFLVRDAAGNIVTEYDAYGTSQQRVTTFRYDGDNRQVSKTDPLGIVTLTAYDAAGNVISRTVAAGTATAETSTFGYDGDNRQTSSTDALGTVTGFAYDAAGNKVRVTDAEGSSNAQTTTYAYDRANRLVTSINPVGVVSEFQYDGAGNQIESIEAVGTAQQRQTTFTYDLDNRLLRSTDPLGRTTQYQYDAQGNKTQVIDAKGNVQTNTFDALGDELTRLSSAGILIRNTYDLFGNLLSTSQSFADGSDARTTGYAYDLLNRQTLMTDANGFSTSTVYDDFGNKVRVTAGQYFVSPSDSGYSAAKAAEALPQTTAYTYDADDRVSSATDALGRATSYTYDSVGNRISTTDANGHVSTSAYDLDNRLIAQTDALGNTQTNRYDVFGNLVATTDALGHTTSNTYDADNRVTSTTDALGNVTQYHYDAVGNRTQVIDPRGFVSTSYFDADGEVVLSVDNDGYTTSYTYDADGNVVSKTLYATAVALPVDPSVQPTVTPNASDQTTLFAYDALNRLVSRTDGDGFVTQYQYDSAGNVIGTRQALNKAETQFEVTRNYYNAVDEEVASVTAQGYLTTYQYDAVGNRISLTQYNQIVSVPADGSIPTPVAGDSGRTTTFAYDADNQLVQQTDALGVVTTYQYDAKGNQIAMTEAAGTADARTTTYQYDAADRYVGTTNGLGITTSLVLDADGNVLTRYDAYGTAQQRVTTFTYDANDQIVSETDPLGVVTRTAYDAAGNVTSKTIAAGTSAARTSTYGYDGDDREVVATDELGSETTFAYDAAGDQTQITEAAGLPQARSNTFVYDQANRLVSATDALGTVTQYQYDGAGNKVLTIQASGTAEQRQTSYAYDLDNRLVQVTDPMGGVTQYQYDAQGNQTRIIDANGGVQVDTFDAMGHALTSLSAGGVLITNTYDLRGNLVSATQSFADGSDARTTTYAYDLLNRQIEVTDGDGFSTSITYDDFGNQLSITHGEYLVSADDPSYSATKAAQAFPQTNTFTYDADNRMLSMTDAAGNVTSYQYDAVGNRISTTDPNGHTTQYTYDLLNRLTQTTTPDGGITRYTYDSVGNEISESQLQSGTPANGVWATTTDQYDANGHVISQTDPMGTVTQYTYDAMGNMLSQTSAAGTSDARTVRMEYDLDNRRTAAIDALGNRTTYGYDAMGNQIQVTDALGHVAHYYYNGDNQLTEVVDPQGFINAFAYDSAGNRIRTVVYMTPVTGTVNQRVPPTPVAGSLDRITTDQFDAANQLIRQTAPDGSVTLYTYDGAGNKVSETQFANTSAPRTATFVYDADDRLVKFTDVDGTVTTFTYDGANNKTSQTISSTTDPNHTRTTTYTYDADNRESSETFDPTGLDIVQSFTYDHLGNMLTQTNGDGNTTRFAYDLNNREVSQTDALGNTATFTYDRVGNRITSTDARGNTTNYVYDADNRLVQEIAPQVQIYTVGVGFSTVRPTTTHAYDADGNEIRTIDANGNVTTSYYDGDNRLIAQVNAQNALTTYTYDAAGDKTSQTLYMTFLSPGSYGPAVLPTPPAGDTEQITYAYDQMGRLTLTTYPPAQITTLVNTNTDNPSSATVTEQVTERNVYDAYGNLVESFDRNGNETLNYYDVKGNKIATVDPAGYLTEWDYDSQGNVLEQRVYTQALDVSTLSPGSTPSPSSLPTPPSGTVYVTDMQYDAASRKIKETDPQIATFDPNTQTTTQVRPTTTYTYDEVGNQLTKTLGAGTAQAVTEYSYYDADNRLIAAIDDARVLSTYSYDANGNQISQKRYINPVSTGVNLAQLSGSTNFASLVSASASQDEESDFAYDALNRQTSQSDLLSSGVLTKSYDYDADGNKTYSKDEDGYVTQASYDGMGRLTESISPDGSGTQYQYDAAGNQILAYTGVLTGGPPTPATNVTASLGSAVKVSWNTVGSAQSPVQTWIVYDTTSHANLGDYANRTSTQVSTNGQGLASITPPAGGTVYFRVVTEDGYGNETWTAEQSITIPPRFSAVSVSQPAAGTIVVTASFDPGVANPQLVYGASGNLSQSVAFVRQSDGSYQATLTGVTDTAGLSFQLQWQDAAGNTYSSATSTFAAQADQVGTTSTVSQSQIVNGASTAYTISVSTQVPSGYAAGLVTMEAQWRIAGSGNAFAATAVAGTNSGQGFETYSAVLGDTSNLAPGTYEIVLTGVRADGTSVELDHFDYVVGASGVTTTRSAISWVAPAVGNDQLVIIDGQSSPSVSDNGRIVATDGSTDASDDYSVFYGTQVSDSHTVSVSSTAQTTSSTDPSNPTGPPIVTTTGYNVTVQAALGANEAVNVGSGGLHLAWRPAGSGTSFGNDVQLTSIGTNTFGTTLSNLSPGQYDLEVYYVDAQGNTVIVEWQRVDAATVSTQFSGHSLTVQAQESGGTIATNPQGVITVTPGLYTGALNVAALSSSLSLKLVATGNAGGSLQTDGRSTGYFIETQYNALNYKIASNAGDGLWRTYGVDGNGNEVQTNLLGDRSNPNYNPANAITTYTAYDARNNKIAAFGAQVEAPDGSGLERAVDRYTYDVLDNVTAHTDALGRTTRYVFNALGTQIEEIDALGGTTQTLVDQFGRTTAQITQSGHTTLSFYDLRGNLVKQIDPMGDVTTYTYDAFGRKLTETDGNGNTTTCTYDQRDRLTSETDALNNTESFVYDGRNDRIKTIYPLGEETDEVYDGLGRVIDTITILGNGQEAHDQRAYDAYGNLISETDAMGRTQTHVYGAFGRLLQDIDQDGNVIAYSYDVYGRKTNAYDPNLVSDPTASSDPSGGKDIQYTYNAAGQTTAINDLATGVSTTYTYDLLGHELSDVVTTPGNVANRDTTYEYDALGELVRWADSVTGDNLNTQYDAEGNVVREYTDDGYDPLGQNTTGNPNFRYIDHVYTYDADRRVISEVQRTTDASGHTSDSIINGYTYDADSNRLTWNNAGMTIVTYTYDADDRVTEGDYFTGSDSNQETWTYDAMGNVLSYITSKDGSQQSSTVDTYNLENRELTSTVVNSQGTQITTNTYDLTMRITQTVLQNNGKTYDYDYSYYGDGREKSVVAFGDANGNSVITYDADKIEIRVDLGQGDNQTRPEFKTFIADNEGHITYEFHDDGKSAQNETDQFLYANGNGVAQNTHATDGTFTVQLDTGTYAQVQNLGESNPGSNLTYTVQAGDTLQGIANVMYGNPSLWFVIADANGLNGGEALKAGTVLIIPNTIKSGTITANNHTVYSQTQITGSTLPNLKTPPPPSSGGGCGSILAIIVVVVIAVVVGFATAGLGDVLVGALGIAGSGLGATLATVAVYAVAGAVVGAIGSVVQQGLFIALGYQQKFSWKDVAGAAVAGAFTGAAAGTGALLKAGQIAGSAVQYARVAEGVFDAAGAASQELIDNGKITSWTGLAAAAAGGYLQGGEEAASAPGASADIVSSGTEAVSLAKDLKYVTPWAQLAETYVRQGSLTPSDWATAVGSTLAQAAVDNLGPKEESPQPGQGETAADFGDRLENTALRVGTQALVAGALSLYNKQTALSYLETSVGQEVGQFLGRTITNTLNPYLPSRTPVASQAGQTQSTPAYGPPTQSGQADSSAEEAAAAPSVQTAATTDDQQDGVADDSNGNPVAPEETAPAATQPDQTEQQADATPSGPQQYTVQRGDTFAKIALEMYGDARYAGLIMQASGITASYANIHNLQTGTILTLPDISNLDDSTDAAILKYGGNLLYKDQSITNQLAARAQAQAAAAAQAAADAQAAAQQNQPAAETSPQGAPQEAGAPAPAPAAAATTETAAPTGGSPGGHYEDFPTYDPASGFPNGGTEQVWVPDKEMSYEEQMEHVGQVGVGVGKGVVNGVPKTVVGLGTLLIEGSMMEGMAEAGMDPQESYQIAKQATQDWWDGTVLPYSNTEQKVGGFLGEFASPFVYGKAVQLATKVPLLFSLGEDLVNASTASETAAAAGSAPVPNLTPPEVPTPPTLTAPEVPTPPAPPNLTAPELPPPPEVPVAGVSPTADITEAQKALVAQGVGTDAAKTASTADAVATDALASQESAQVGGGMAPKDVSQIAPETTEAEQVRETGAPNAPASQVPALPEGYTYNADTGAVTGPRGGTYTPTGAQDEAGNVIYRTSGGYATLDANAGRVPVESPFPGTANYQQGREFQDALTEATGLTENTSSVTQTLPDGTDVTTIPDFMGRPAGGVVEAKSNLYLADSDQLRAQRLYAQANGMPYTLVVTPYTQISQPLVDAITAIKGNTIYRFDPVTQLLQAYP